MSKQLSLDLGLAFIPETSNPLLFEELYKVYNAINIIALALDQYTGTIRRDVDEWPALSPLDTIRVQNISKIYVPFSEDIGPGRLVTLFNDSGVTTGRLAGGPPVFAGDWAGDCRGYSSLPTTVSAGDFGEVTLFGLHPLLTGATPAALYYVDNTTAGLFTSTEPTSTGLKVQRIGYALSSGAIWFNPELNVTLIP